MNNETCSINISLDVASTNDFDELKEIMYNEEIREKEKQGLNFNRRFIIFAVLHCFRRIVRVIFKREIVFLCLKENGIICGGLITDINLSENKAGIGYVSIKENDRGRGLGTILIKETLNYLKTKCVKKVELFANSKNIIANHLYSKNGFKKVGMIYASTSLLTSRKLRVHRIRIKNRYKSILFNLLFNEIRDFYIINNHNIASVYVKKTGKHIAYIKNEDTLEKHFDIFAIFDVAEIEWVEDEIIMRAML